MVTSFKKFNAEIEDISTIKGTVVNVNAVSLESAKNPVTIENINLYKSISKKPCSDRFVDKDGNYNEESLNIIRECEYLRNSYGGKVEPAFRSNEEVIEALEKLDKIYSEFEGFSYYNQNLYPETYKYDSIQISGCCPTCFAMIATYLTGEDVLPTDVVEAFYDYCYTSGTDVTGNCFPDVASKYGLEAKRLNFDDRDALISELEAGHPIILNVKQGRFTGSGHYIVLLGIDENGNVIIADPNSVSNSTQTYTIDELIREAHNTDGAAWSFSK